MPFTALGLSDRITRGVDASGYTTPTPIQNLAIPRILTGRDIIGCAQTGTGKTAAFVLPLLDILSRSTKTKGRTPVRSLILAPTRELALQVEESITTYGKFTNITSTAVFGGVSMDNQIKRLQRGVDVVVATPGRLLDHLERKTIDLSQVSVLVLDEADRMFDMGFIKDVRRIIAYIPGDRQTLLFSATMSKEIQDLVRSVQRDAELVEVGLRTRPADTVSQEFYDVKHAAKMDLLNHLLRSKETGSVLIFSRTKHNADKICKRLTRAGFLAVAIHSNRTQAQRQRALAGFKQGEYRILVATDIAARGIDVDGISHVINYDTPVFAEDYIHRIGRTGRAEAVGSAITFVSEREQDALKRIERFIGKKQRLLPSDMVVPMEKDAPVRTGGSAGPVEHRRGGQSRPAGYAGRKKGNPQQRTTQGQKNGRPAQRRPRRVTEPAPVKEKDWRGLVDQIEKDTMGKRIARFFRG